MNQKENYYTWEKGEKTSINKYFNTSEFTCKCSYPECKSQKISVNFINRLTKVREELNKGLIITSGFRCSRYQKDLAESGANTVVAKLSQHEMGNAADVVPMHCDIATFQPICEKQFKAIGIAKNFLHLDTRNDKVRRWYY
jgi:uncharacterized protein YcbK (DUF882 family)